MAKVMIFFEILFQLGNAAKKQQNFLQQKKPPCRRAVFYQNIIKGLATALKDLCNPIN